MQVRIRRAIERYPRTSISNVVRESVEFGVEWPYNHVVRTNRDAHVVGIIGSLERVVETVLRSTAEHVDESRGWITWSLLFADNVLEPYQTHWIGGHWDVASDIFVSRKARPLVHALREDFHRAVVLELGDAGICGDLTRTRCHGSSHFSVEDLLFERC